MAKGNAVIANSDYTAKNITKNYNIELNQVDIIPRGVNSEDYNIDQFSDKSINKLRSEWSEDKNQKIILLPARYSDWKGHELAIKAISKIKEKNTDHQISLIFVGNKEANNKYIIKLKKIAKKFNVDTNLKILGNFDICHWLIMLAILHFTHQLNPNLLEEFLLKLKLQGA